MLILRVPDALNAEVELKISRRIKYKRFKFKVRKVLHILKKHKT